MPKLVLIQHGRIHEEVQPGQFPPEVVREVPDEAQIGWLYDEETGAVSSPPEDEPEAVAARLRTGLIAQRASLFKRSAWIRERQEDELALVEAEVLEETTLPEAVYALWLDWWQALRDLALSDPETDPAEVEIPAPPDASLLED